MLNLVVQFLLVVLACHHCCLVYQWLYFNTVGLLSAWQILSIPCWKQLMRIRFPKHHEGSFLHLRIHFCERGEVYRPINNFRRNCALLCYNGLGGLRLKTAFRNWWAQGLKFFNQFLIIIIIDPCLLWSKHSAFTPFWVNLWLDIILELRHINLVQGVLNFVEVVAIETVGI